MPQVDFLISNDRHHVATLLPVARILAAEAGYACRFLSLCEVRGFKTPREKLEGDRLSVESLIPFHVRSSPSAGSGGSSHRASFTRRVARQVLWSLGLAPRLRMALRSRPDVVVLCNDAAYPYDHICTMLRRRRIPFVLVQEGIRFPLPGVTDEDAYGRGGAAAIAAWGTSSATYFRERGVPPQTIHVTGTPRFEGIRQHDWAEEAERLRRDLEIGPNVLLLLTNPIDDQGFCTTEEKYTLVRNFIRGIGPLLVEEDQYLVVKLHGRESIDEYRILAAENPVSDRVRVTQDVPLYPLIALSRAAVILASTVGLEALMMSLPLGVLALPGYGFVHDYVQRGAAVGLRLDDEIISRVARLIHTPEDAGASRRYVAESVASFEGVAQVLADLVHEIAGTSTPGILENKA